MPDMADLRSRLIALRADVLSQLARADVLSPGHLALLADTDAALLALDAEAEQRVLDDAAVAERVVIVGCEDATIKIIAYRGSTPASCVTINPRRAIAIALDLLDLAHRRWPG